MRRRRNDGTFTVTGPGTDRTTPSPGAGMSLGQTLAALFEEPVTFYVRDALGKTVATVERDEDGIIWTRRVAA